MLEYMQPSPARIRCISLIVLPVLIVAGIAFLIITQVSNRDIVARRVAYVVFSPVLVYPGPGDNTPGAYCEGDIMFHLVEHTIQWKLFYGGLGTVLALELFGPVLPTNPLDGPVFLTLCGPPTAIACLSSAPQVLEQKITETSPLGQPLNDYIKDITRHPAEYKIRIKTQNFPDGAMVARLNIVF